ncbi:short-chain dehydrogenase [Burkholderia sp. AU31652]|uniref:SDR family oxidoreductase n=1 Tax=unclassified Burkholderia TaxID=2613784 RepID=UPI000B7A759E|nr:MULTISPECIES: SDR family oxidoreductase [unclassified Burkholderia]MDN7486750.1 SDR family oxidoreductase [Burkholderia sp. AU45274]OXI83836.1 short-chain dehydrogenase [Burkholderia sp. AU31652]
MHNDTGRVVVLGGSSGIGLATVRRLAGAGYDVIATGRDADKLQAATASIDGSVRIDAFDGAQREQLERFFASAGSIDHLVIALSGGDGAGPFRELDLGSLRRGFDAKFWPHVQAAQAALPTLRSGGSITFVTAISARVANPGTSGLAAINAAIEAMVPVLARELAPTRVNAVSPGVVKTPWWNGLPDDARQAFFEQHASALPVGRIGEPDDVAQAIAFLIGNGYTTGSVIECDGGLHLL